MIIHEKTIHYYIERLKRGRHFCFPGYSDAEFYSMMGIRAGGTTGLGQIIDVEHGQKPLDVIKRRQGDRNWLFAIPKCLWQLPMFEENAIDKYLASNDVKIEGYERDMVLDNLAADAGLYPFIQQIKKMHPKILIGPNELSNGGINFLDIHYHHKIPSPNLHIDVDRLEEEIKTLKTIEYSGSVYLISAGVSAPIIIDRLYEFDSNNFYIDCGSIWDAFCGIGGQRQWRADLYKNPKRLEIWKRKNIYGK